ncbi:MAG: hypothetical protein HC866_22650 [Leptolyngbyaceae cyanobacterium RU_5_1]|nr:hypothetical protein [Leptolyngbyaceae cyanobacterium RU_5_1]
MTLEELTQLSAVQQTMLTRHDREMAEIRAILQQSATRQTDQEAAIARHEQWLADQETAIARHEQWLADQEAASVRHEQAIARHEQEMGEIRALQQSNQEQLALNQEQLALLTAGLVDLRNLVADYLQGRSQL